MNLRKQLLAFLVTIVTLSTANITYAYVPAGKGCTTAYYIDMDCDGYGVGYATLTGPDADDRDPNVNAPSTVADKESFITNTLGYGPTSEWIFVSKSGNNSTCDASANYDTAESKPCLTVSKAFTLAGAGDTVVIKMGTYDENHYWDYNKDGTAGNPIVAISYPGDRVIIKDSTNDISTQGLEYWTLDGFEFDMVGIGKFSFGSSKHLTIRNCEFYNGGQTYGVVFGHNHQNLKFEYNYIHDNRAGGEHIMYIGSNQWVTWTSNDWVIRGNVFRSNANVTSSGDNLQINAMQETSNITIEDNVFAASSIWSAITLYGTDKCTIQNNVFLGPHHGVLFLGHTWSPPNSYPTHYSVYPVTNLKFINNSVLLTDTAYSGQASETIVKIWDHVNWNPSAWQSNYSYATRGTTVSPTAGDNGFIYSVESPCTSGAVEPRWPTTHRATVSDGSCKWYAMQKIDGRCTNNIIRNNIVYTYDRPIFKISESKFYDGTTADTLTIDNNVIHRNTGTTVAILGGLNKTSLQFEAIDDGGGDSIKNNTWADPLLVSVDNVHSTPGAMDLRTLVNSPAYDTGLSTACPAKDIKGVTRDRCDVGAYHIGSKDEPPTFPPQSPSGLRIVSSQSAPLSKIVDNGDSSAKLDMVFISSGFTANEMNDYSAKVSDNVDKMFSVNWFDSNRGLFNIWRIDHVSAASGTELDQGTVQSLASLVPFDIVVVIHNKDGQETQHKGYVELYKYSHNYVVLAHELGHIIGYLSDEYYYNPVSICYSKQTLNIHDKPSNEKWSDLIQTPPHEGGHYCPQGLWRPSDNSIMKDSAHCTYFDAVGLYAMDVGAGKILGTVEDQGPYLSVSGIQDYETKSGTFSVHVDTSDVSGIDRVEFYLRNDNGGVSRSIKIDKTVPYDVTIDTSNYQVGQYSLFVYSYDEVWNYYGQQIIFYMATP